MVRNWKGIKMYDRNLNKRQNTICKMAYPVMSFTGLKKTLKGNMWISTTNGARKTQPCQSKIKVFKKEHGLTVKSIQL